MQMPIIKELGLDHSQESLKYSIAFLHIGRKLKLCQEQSKS